MTSNQHTTTDAHARGIELLLVRHAYELSNRNRQTAVCRCGFVPDVQPETLQTQQDYHTAHVAEVVAARLAAVTTERDQALAAAWDEGKWAAYSAERESGDGSVVINPYRAALAATEGSES